MQRRRDETARTGGLTLIEVVAALALLGTLLTALVMARARYVQQWSSAEARLAAIEAADQLLEGWWQSGEAFAAVPRSGQGAVGEGLMWRTTARSDDALADLDAEVVRLEIVRGARGFRGFRGSGEAGPVLVSVDLFVPTEPAGGPTR